MSELLESARIPAILIAVVAATLTVDGFDLASRAGVSVLGWIHAVANVKDLLITNQQVFPVHSFCENRYFLSSERRTI